MCGSVGSVCCRPQATFGLAPDLGGLSFYCQAAMADPLLPNGLAFTNGLEVTVCP